MVQDGGSPARSATGTAFITVLDDNDNDPSFSHSQAGKNLIMQVGHPDQRQAGTQWLAVNYLLEFFVDKLYNHSVNPHIGDRRSILWGFRGYAAGQRSGWRRKRHCSLLLVRYRGCRIHLFQIIWFIKLSCVYLHFWYFCMQMLLTSN